MQLDITLVKGNWIKPNRQLKRMFDTHKQHLHLLKLVCVAVLLILLGGTYKYMISDTRDTLEHVVLTEKFPIKLESVSDTKALAGKFRMKDTGLDLLFKNLSTEQANWILHKFILTSQTTCKNKSRFGRPGDGGYWVCMDEDVAPKKNDCLVYSFGIKNEWSFDDAIHDELQCEVHAFDPSMNRVDHQRKSKLFFHNLGIWDHNYTNNKGWQLAGLAEIRRMLNHTNRVIDYMKIDVEGAEWPIIDEMVATHSSQNVKQMMFEIHTPKFRGSQMTVYDYSHTYTSLRRLDKNLGFKLWYHNHVNNCCARFATLTSSSVTDGVTLCCYELFYMNKMVL